MDRFRDEIKQEADEHVRKKTAEENNSRGYGGTILGLDSIIAIFDFKSCSVKMIGNDLIENQSLFCRRFDMILITFLPMIFIKLPITFLVIDWLIVCKKLP